MYMTPYTRVCVHIENVHLCHCVLQGNILGGAENFRSVHFLESYQITSSSLSISHSANQSVFCVCVCLCKCVCMYLLHDAENMRKH